MVIKIVSEESYTQMALEGSLDTNTSKEAEDQLNQLLDEGKIKILLDLSNLEYISSAGLRVLLLITKKLKPLGGELRICGLNETVKEVFDISGFSMIFKIFNTADEAKEGF